MFLSPFLWLTWLPSWAPSGAPLRGGGRGSRGPDEQRCFRALLASASVLGQSSANSYTGRCQPLETAATRELSHGAAATKTQQTDPAGLSPQAGGRAARSQQPALRAWLPPRSVWSVTSQTQPQPQGSGPYPAPRHGAWRVDKMVPTFPAGQAPFTNRPPSPPQENRKPRKWVGG